MHCCQSIEEIQELNDKMVYDFTMHIKELRKTRIVSHHIRKCIGYIYNNLHEPLMVNSISRQIGLNPSYLSALFKKETGKTIHAFIQETRLDTATEMLKKQNIHMPWFQIHCVFPHKAILQSFFVSIQGWHQKSTRQNTV